MILSGRFTVLPTS
jgi:aryl-alcohol dehydrogenase-like predicted oxidoreductase